MKRTVLHDKHLQLKARMTEFQGWQVPQAYSDALEEHHAVRTAAGLFDIGFLTRIEITGSGARDLLERVFTRNVGRMPERSAHYGLLCTEEGHILDDAVLFLLPARPPATQFLLTTNAQNSDAVLAWLNRHGAGDVAIVDRTPEQAHLALQGPKSPSIIEKFLSSHAKKFKPRAVREFRLDGFTLLAARTGYTGEHGYELIVPADRAVQVWDSIMDHGRDFGILPCGLASRDMLRIEMGYRLFGIDIDGTRSPLEAGLERFVDLKKDFIGRESLLAAQAAGTDRRFAGFALMDRSVPRPGGSIFSENREIGTVTSGAFSPSLRKGIGLGYLVARYAQPGQEIEVEIRDQEYAARIVELPFYRKK